MLSGKIKAIPIGTRYGSWVVEAYAGEKGKGRNTYWLCRCDCGHTSEVCGSLLRTGKSSKCQRCSGKDNGRLALDAMSKKHLYVVRCGEFFKIGSSDNPERRIKDLETGNPYEIETVAILYGRGHEEADWHTRYKQQHHRGEWFRGFCEIN